jgi:hypothetical protein
VTCVGDGFDHGDDVSPRNLSDWPFGPAGNQLAPDRCFNFGRSGQLADMALNKFLGDRGERISLALRLRAALSVFLCPRINMPPARSRSAASAASLASASVIMGYCPMARRRSLPCSRRITTNVSLPRSDTRTPKLGTAASQIILRVPGAAGFMAFSARSVSIVFMAPIPLDCQSGQHFSLSFDVKPGLARVI